jgi:hypothetical protein
VTGVGKSSRRKRGLGALQKGIEGEVGKSAGAADSSNFSKDGSETADQDARSDSSDSGRSLPDSRSLSTTCTPLTISYTLNHATATTASEHLNWYLKGETPEGTSASAAVKTHITAQKTNLKGRIDTALRAGSRELFASTTCSDVAEMSSTGTRWHRSSSGASGKYSKVFNAGGAGGFFLVVAYIVLVVGRYEC